MPDIDFSHCTGLVVDDNDFMRYTIRKHLMDFGFKTVLEAPNGVEGIASLKYDPDIIICDIGMEPVNGFEFLKMLRSNKTPHKYVPVIFLTGDGDAETVQKAIDLSVNAYLLKPVQPEALRKKIIYLLTRALSG